MASLSTAMVAALMRRGVDKHTAQLATDMGMSVSRMAAERWVADDTTPLAEHLARAAQQLRSIAAESSLRP